MAKAYGLLLVYSFSPPLRNPIATLYNSLDPFRLADGFACRTLTKCRFSKVSIVPSAPPLNSLARVDDPAGLERALANTVGVVESGLFIGMADTALVGTANGVETLTRAIG